MKRLFFISVLLFTALVACKKTDKRIACETDQECTALIYGKWQHKTGLYHANRNNHEFIKDSLLIIYIGEFGSAYIYDTLDFYINGNTLFKVENIDPRAYTIKTLNSKRLTLERQTYEDDYTRVE